MKILLPFIRFSKYFLLALFLSINYIPCVKGSDTSWSGGHFSTYQNSSAGYIDIEFTIYQYEKKGWINYYGYINQGYVYVDGITLFTIDGANRNIRSESNIGGTLYYLKEDGTKILPFNGTVNGENKKNVINSKKYDLKGTVRWYYPCKYINRSLTIISKGKWVRYLNSDKDDNYNVRNEYIYPPISTPRIQKVSMNEKLIVNTAYSNPQNKEHLKKLIVTFNPNSSNRNAFKAFSLEFVIDNDRMNWPEHNDRRNISNVYKNSKEIISTIDYIQAIKDNWSSGLALRNNIDMTSITNQQRPNNLITLLNNVVKAQNEFIKRVQEGSINLKLEYYFRNETFRKINSKYMVSTEDEYPLNYPYVKGIYAHNRLDKKCMDVIADISSGSSISNASTKFNVYRSEDNTNFSKIGEFNYQASAGTYETKKYVFQDLKIDVNKKYTYRVIRDYPYSNLIMTGISSNQVQVDYSLITPSNLTPSWDNYSANLNLSWNFSKDSVPEKDLIIKIFRRSVNDIEWGDNIYTNTEDLEFNSYAQEYYFTDKTAESCHSYEYRVEAIIGKSFDFFSKTVSATTSVFSSKIEILSISKGVYSDGVDIQFKKLGGDSDITIQRRVYNSDGEWREIGKITDVPYNKVITFTDDKCGSDIYEYRLSTYDFCEGEENSEPIISYYPINDPSQEQETPSGPAIGFKKTLGTVTGRITFDGGNAVEGVDVQAIPSSNNKNSAIFFNKEYSMELGTAMIQAKNTPFNFNEDFSLQAWIGSEIKYPDVVPEKEVNSIIPIIGTDDWSFSYISQPGKRKFFLVSNNVEYEPKAPKKISYENGLNDAYLPIEFVDSISVISKDRQIERFYWDQVSLVRENDSLLLYVNGQFIGSKVIPNSFVLSQTNELRLMASYEVVSALDELRFWNKSLTEKEVQKTYNKFLTGNESGLKGYWKFDARVPSAFYDYSFTDKTPNENHGWGHSILYTYDTPSEEQLSCRDVTDELGNYIISGISLKDEGTSYRVIPGLESHRFEPKEEILYFDNNTYIHNKISFTDKSSFTVSGICYYSNTKFPVEGAMVKVDGAFAYKDSEIIKTSKNGDFSVDVAIGEHSISLYKDGHVFENDGKFPIGKSTLYNIKQDMTIPDPFFDATLYRVAGRIVGGPREYNKSLGFNKTINNLGYTSLLLKASFKENLQLTSIDNPEEDRIVIIEHPRYEVNAQKKDTIRHYTKLTYSKVNNEYLIKIEPDSITGEFFADLIPENFYTKEVIAGVDFNDSSKKFKLSEDFMFPIDLKEKYGNNEYLTWETGDSVTYVDPKDPIKKVMQPIVDSIAYSGISRNYIRRNLPSIKITDYWSGSSFLGDSVVYITNPMNNELIPIDIMSYDTNKNKIGYKFNNLPVFTQGNYYSIKARLIEVYRNSYNEDDLDEVPMSDGELYISNNLALEKNKIVPLDDNGEAVYTFMGGQANMTIDDQDPLNSYTATMNIMAISGDGGTITNWRPVNNPLQAYLLGTAITGSNFTTKGPENVIMVLRDPPGSNSSMTYHKGSYFGSNYSLEYGNGSSQDLTHEFVVGQKITGGVGAGVGAFFLTLTDAVKTDNRVGIHFTAEENKVRGNTWETRITLESDYSTSSSPEYVGTNGDVFIGNSYNLVFSDAKTIRIYPNDISLPGIDPSSKIDFGNGFYMAQRDAKDCSPEFKTSFVYTQSGIEDKIIPDLIDLRDKLLYDKDANVPSANSVGHTVYKSLVANDDENFGKEGFYTIDYPTNIDGFIQFDSIASFNMDVERWKHQLGLNEKDKYLSSVLNEPTNISFEAGSVYESSLTTTSDSTTIVKGLDYTTKLGATGSAYWHIGVVGMNTSAEVSWDHSHSSRENKLQGSEIITSYHLEDEDAGNFFTVDVFPSKNGWGPVFRTRGGQTCCPYEDETKINYYDPQKDPDFSKDFKDISYDPNYSLSVKTANVDVPVLTIPESMISGVPGNKSAAFQIELNNESESKTDLIYQLMVMDQTNPNGAILELDGQNLAIPRPVYVPYGTTVKKTLTLSRSKEDVFEYKNVGISLRSACQNDPTSNFPAIESNALITAMFVPSCGDITIDKALDNTIVNIHEMDPNANYSLNGIFPITIKDFDYNNKLLNKIILYYKTVNESQGDWKLIKDYYKTPEVGQMEIPKGNIEYDLDLNLLNDDKYQIKAVAYGTGNFKSETDVLTFTKNTSAVVPFGIPQPADGILSPGDEISIAFNKNIQESKIIDSKIDPSHLKITGYLNNQETGHNVGALFDSNDDYIIMPNGVNLGNKDFTIEFYLKSLKKGTNQTLLSHGSDQSLFEVGFTKESKMFIVLGSKTYYSDNVLSTHDYGEVFATYLINYNHQTSKFRVYINSSLVMSITNDIKLTNSPLIVGRNAQSENPFKGVIHDLRIWDKSVTSTTLNNSLVGNEAGLYMYWPLNDSFGKVSKEKSRENHAVMKAQWYIDPLGYSVHLNGSNYVAIPLYSLTTQYNYTIDMWFKAEAQQGGEVTLFANGAARNMSPTYEGEFCMNINTDGQLVYYSSGNIQPVSEDNVIDNQWHHIAVCANRNGATTFYLDGIQKNSYKGVSLSDMHAGHITLGACCYADQKGNQVTDSFFKGNVDEFRFWKLAQNEDNLLEYMHHKLIGNEPGLTDYYSFDKFNKVGDILEQSMQNQVTNKTDIALVQDKLRNPMKEDLVSGIGVIPTFPISNVSFNWALKDNQIMFTLDDSEEARRRYENCLLTISAKDLYDQYNNESNPVCWSAYVDLKNIRWNDKKFSAEIEKGEKLTFEREITNIGGTIKYFEINNLPQWLTVVPASGKLMPTETQTIKFTVNPNVNIGYYDQSISLDEYSSMTSTSPLYSDKMTLDIKVGAVRPQWIVDISEFEHSMNIFGDLKIEGVLSSDVNDMLAAFAGEKCIGVTSPYYIEKYGKYGIFMRVYGNETSSKDLNFRIWDAGTGKIYPAQISQDIVFKPDAVYGSITSPVLFETTSNVYQNILLDKGWNWISFNVNSETLKSTNILLNRLECTPGDIFKDQNSFTMYSEKNGWKGTFADEQALSSKSMYKIKMNKNNTISISGVELDPVTTQLDIVGGKWNFISYLPQENMTINEAFANYQAQENDIIKSINSFAIYDSKVGWIGDLSTMQSGKGYILFRQKDNTSFHYPDNVVSLSSNKKVSAKKAIITNDRGVNYSENMNIVAQVKGINMSMSDKIVALVSDTIPYEGSKVNYNGEDLYFFTLGTDLVSDSQIKFEVKSNEKALVSTEFNLNLKSDNVIGSLKEPLVIDFDAFISSQGLYVYPNPFENEVTISIPTPNQGKVKIEIFDMSGRMIRIENLEATSNNTQFIWNGEISSGVKCDAGIYLVKVYVDNKNYTQKIKKQ